MFKEVLAIVLFGLGVFAVVLGCPAVAFEKPENSKYQVLKPANLEEVDFTVPWGFRFGRPARVFLSFEVGPEGQPENIEILKTIPHKNYLGVAKTTLKKFRYPGVEPGTLGFAEMHYCVQTDQQSTFGCKITFRRLNGTPGLLAEKPGEPGFYEIDKYGGIPRVKRPVLPFYPEAAAKRSECGWVRVDVAVNRFGVVKGVEIKETSETGLFSLVVKEAFGKFRFEKGEEEVVIPYLVAFEIPGKCELASLKVGR